MKWPSFLIPSWKRDNHEEVERRLAAADKDLKDHARRIRQLEIEAGIFRPQLREVNGS